MKFSLFVVALLCVNSWAGAVGEVIDDTATKTVNLSVKPTQIETAKPKSLGMNLIPKEQCSIVSDVGTLERIQGLDIEGVKYVLRNNGVLLRFIIEPSDVDMSPMVGRTISISGTTIGRSYSDVSVIQMRNASTFG